MWAAVVVAAVFGVHGLALANGFVNWDDLIYVVENPAVTDPGLQTLRDRITTPNLGYPVPLPVLLYGWLWQLGDGSPLPFHLLNLLVHAGAALVVFAVISRACLQFSSAALLAIAFAVHPLVVEPVAWVTGLKDLLMGLGFALAWTWRHRPAGQLAGGLLALASKPVAVAVGPAMAFCLWLDRRRGDPVSRASWAAAGGLTLVGVGLALWSITAEDESLRTTLDVGPSVVRIFGAAGLMAGHALVPVGLGPRYTPEMVPPGMVVLGIVALVTAIIHLWSWTKRSDVRAGLVVASLLAYLPVSNLRPLVRYTADSYAYTPWILVALIVGLTLASAPKWSPRVRLMLLGACIAWGVLSAVRVGEWKSSDTLWQAAYEATPEDPETIVRFGDALGRAGRPAEELALYANHLEELRRAPKVPVALLVYFERSGQLEPARDWYAHAFALPTAQDPAVYWYYAEFVAKHPALHGPKLDAALAHALPLHAEHRGPAGLNPAQLRVLAGQAQRLGLGELAGRYREWAG